MRLGARDVESPGWDSLTGFGVLNVGNSLNLPADKLPIADPLEPNDNIVWVDGTAFGKPPPAVWSGGAATRVNALLDKQEDPVDVYRIVIPGGRTAKISVIPRFGDPSLEVFTLLGDLGQRRGRRVAYSLKRRQEDRAGDGPQRAASASTRTTSRSARRATRATRSASTRCASAEPAQPRL